MRAFLGLTWIYAGWDKASDPGFLTEGSSSFIGTQLAAYSTNSPIGFLISPLLEQSTQVGIFVMVSEFAIGIATLLWIAPATAAVSGFFMSVGLWLASSFYVEPYFFASNSAYAILWLSFFLLIRKNVKKKIPSLDRRSFIRFSIAGVAAGLAALTGKFFQESFVKVAGNNQVTATNPTRIIRSDDLKIGQRHAFTTSQGTSAILFRTSAGFFAYTTICTHQGCAVTYSEVAENLQCPCHGAVFDPFSEGKVLAGPTNTPLAKVALALSGPWIVES
jgi:thiosulfate dehydrogenase [quinone] large subunit